MILQVYGSAQNGVVNSISQFLSIFSMMDLGVGAVVETALYRPLAQKNKAKIDEIVSAANHFFKILSGLLCVYVAVLAFFYPTVVGDRMPYLGTVTLVLAMSVTAFAQFFVGMVDSLLLSADQRLYISDLTNMITLVINTIVGAVLIFIGLPIQAVELGMALIYLIRPLAIRIYVNRRYAVNRHAAFTKDSIPQKWNGMSQHLSYIILQNTDVVVLTLFNTMQSVSIYTVYLLAINGIKSVFAVVCAGVDGRMGELWAKQRYRELNDFLVMEEWFVHTIASALFGCVSALIVPFALVYTSGVQDANYNQPLFGMLLSLAYLITVLREPYNSLVQICGHFRQTQKYYSISAAINIVLSILMVRQFGLVGVTIGTLIAMLFQGVCLAGYCIRNLPAENAHRGRLLLTDIVVFGVISAAGRLLPFTELTYLAWIKMGIGIAALAIALCAVLSVLFFRKELRLFVNTVRN